MRFPPRPRPTPVATAPSFAANGDSWRYQYYNGYWWYWTPDNHWLCYMNGQWVSPGAPAQASVAVPAYQYVVPQPSYYPYGYAYPYGYPYYGYPYYGGLYFGFGGYGGYWHGGYYGHGGYHR